MDINLLSQLIKESILENDKVSFISMGSFMAEVMPASVSDRGTVINPPYRRLYYRFSEKSDDKILVKLFAEREKISLDEAEKIMTAFLKEFREELNREKLVIFPGLGRMKASISNDYFFIPDDNLDIYPDGVGLEPLNMKVLKREEEVPQREEIVSQEREDAPQGEEKVSKEREEVPQGEEKVSQKKEDAPQGEEKIAKVEEKATQSEEKITQDNTPQEKQILSKKRKFPIWIALLITILAILIIFFIIMYICSDADWVWKLLYNEEQLKILGKNF